MVVVSCPAWWDIGSGSFVLVSVWRVQSRRYDDRKQRSFHSVFVFFSLSLSYLFLVHTIQLQTYGYLGSPPARPSQVAKNGSPWYPSVLGSRRKKKKRDGYRPYLIDRHVGFRSVPFRRLVDSFVRSFVLWAYGESFTAASINLACPCWSRSSWVVQVLPVVTILVKVHCYDWPTHKTNPTTTKKRPAIGHSRRPRRSCVCVNCAIVFVYFSLCLNHSVSHFTD